MRPELVEGRFDKLSAHAFADLDLLIDREQNKIADVDVARSREHVQDGIGDILRRQPRSSGDAIGDRRSVSNLP